MTLLGDMAALTLLLTLVATSCVAMLYWTHSFANLLWMVALRPRLTAPVTLLLFLTISFLIEILFRFPAFSPTAVTLSLVLAPMLAVPAVDAIAYYMTRRTGGQNANDKIRGFVFHELRAQMRAAYEAPPVQP